MKTKILSVFSEVRLFNIILLLPIIRLIPINISLNVVLIIILASIPILQVKITDNLINSITLIIEDSNNNFKSAVFFLIIQTIIVISTLLLEMFKGMLTLTASQKVNFHLENNILNKLENIPYKLFEDPKFIDLLNKSDGVGERGISLIYSTLSIIQSIITVVGFSFILVHHHWVLITPLLIITVHTLITNMKLGHQKYRFRENQILLMRKAGYLLDLLKSKEGAKEIRIFGNGKYIKDYWSKLFIENSRANLKFEKYLSSINLLLSCVGNLITFITTFILIFLASKGTMSVGSYVALSQAILSSQGLLSNIAIQLSRIYENFIFSKDYLHFTRLSEVQFNNKMEFPPVIKEGIRINNLSYNYNNNNVLNNISTFIRPNEKIAIVGANGAGKSTFVKCLLGLYSDYSGEILIDNLDVKQINSVSFRKNVTALFQDYLRYNLKVRENIAFGNLDKLNCIPSLVGVATLTNADKFIDRLKDGYDTELGPQFIGGQELSGGQWQKIALSRALIKNSQIVVLDEPSAALDPLSEAALFNQFIQITRGKISIFVSHRLGSCITADRILVLKDGKIIEEGKHDELLLMNGEYAKMFREQAKWYSDANMMSEI